MRSLPAALARVLLVLVLLPLLSLLAVVAHAQDTTVVVADPSGSSPLGLAAIAAAVILAGWISEKMYDGFKTILPFYDRLPAIVHQVVSPLWGFLFGWVTTATGVELITDLSGVTAGWIGGVVVAGLQAGIKRYEKSKAPSDATVTLEASRASTGTPPVRAYPRDI